MKLNVAKINIETSGDMEEKMFSIDDVGMIFDILRNRMYSDPIRAICREISCNARDANREVGNEHIPCEISLPNSWEPYYKIKDFGPGISPDRMENIFIRYTASTKRNDNTQTGGFGIGSKTPFSYSDTFSIETNVDGIKYNYTCFIDETKVGKLLLMSSDITTDPNGTEIIIPVKSHDFYKFKDDTEFTTRHWKVKPVIRGGSLTYTDFTPSLTGKNYAIAKSDNDYTLREVKLIIDDIEYPLDLDSLKNKSKNKIFNAIKGVLYLYFNIGDLSLSATREAVHLDAPTQALINSRFTDILNDFKVDISNKIDGCASLWDANVYYNHELKKTFCDLDFLGDLFWKGHKLTTSGLELRDCRVHVFYTAKKHYKGTMSNRILDNVQNYISFTGEKTEIYINDLLNLEEPKVKHVKNAFDKDSNLKYLNIIVPNENVSIDDILTTNKLEQYTIKKLSEITKVGRQYTFSGKRLLIFKIDSITRSFHQISCDDMEQDANIKIISSFRKDYSGKNRSIILKNGVIISNEVLSSLFPFIKGHSIYGVEDGTDSAKIEENFSDFLPIEKVIDDVLNNSNLDFIKIAYAIKNKYHLDRNHSLLEGLVESVKNQNSLFVKYVRLNSEVKSLFEERGNIFSIYQGTRGVLDDIVVNVYITLHPEFDLKKMKEEVNATYPLLQYLDFYNAHRSFDPIVHYVNLVDKEINP